MALTDYDSVALPKAFFNDESAVGETVSGVITEIHERQTRDFKTLKPNFWEDGQPQMQLAIVVDTQDGSDESERTVFIKTWGLQMKNLRAAVKEAGYEKLSEAITVGQKFTATYAGDEAPVNRGMSPTKVYEYSIG